MDSRVYPEQLVVILEMSMLLQESTKKYEGKTLSHFEDEFGNRLDDLHMIADDFYIVFKDGAKIRLAPDWRGNEVYLSQYEI